MNQLMWFRNGLRGQDNAALTAAMQAGATLALFLISPGQWCALQRTVQRRLSVGFIIGSRQPSAGAASLQTLIVTGDAS